jgi:RimJ/RimL family protein N-acetyltransferase
MTLQTERMILRPWNETDAVALYKYACDPNVGPIAGWPVHSSVENSRQIIRDVLSADETYAIVLNGDKCPIGSIGLTIHEKGGRNLGQKGGEIGYWIGVPFWGKGLVPEAVRELMRHSFEDLGLETLWCGYYDGNDKSRRVQEKCGFIYHHTDSNSQCPLLNETRIEHFTCITKEQWMKTIR